MDNMTPKGLWDAMFANRMKANSPATVGAVPSAADLPAAQPSPSGGSLSVLAAGGQNLAQKWMAQVADSGNPQPSSAQQFSWSTPFQT